MEDSKVLYLSDKFPEVCEPPGRPGIDCLIVRTCQDASRGGVLVAGTPDATVQVDPEIWGSHIGEEFRDLCDKYSYLKTTIQTGCKDDHVRKAFDAVCERLHVLRDLIMVASYDYMAKPKSLPDIGVVVAVGANYRDDYEVGDKVALRPGDVYYEVDGVDFRILRSRYDEGGEFLYDATDSVPIKLTDHGPEAVGTWIIAKRNLVKFEIQTNQKFYTDAVAVDGADMLFQVKDPANNLLTFRNPEDWGLTDDHCLVDSCHLLAAVPA